MKRLSARQYATALDAALTDSGRPNMSVIAGQFLHRLRRDRAMRLMPRILEHLKVLESARHGRIRVTVEAPTSEAADALLKHIKKADATVIIDPSLRRGLAVTIDDRRLDASLTGRLHQLHRSLVSSS